MPLHTPCNIAPQANTSCTPSLQVICWDSDQVSRIHDHQGAHGYVTVLDVSVRCSPRSHETSRPGLQCKLCPPKPSRPQQCTALPVAQ